MILNTKETLKALKLVAKAMDNRPSLPILSAVRLQWAEGKLTIDGTNLETWIKTTIPCETTEGEIGLAVVSNKELINLLTAMQSLGEIEWNTLNAPTRYDAAEFPPYPNFENDTPDFELEMDGQNFQTMVVLTMAAVSKKDNRPILCGINYTDGYFAAADGYQLAVYDTGNREKSGGTYCTTHYHGMDVMRSCIQKKSHDKVTMRFFRQRFAELRYQDIEILAFSLDGRFPDFTAIKPRGKEGMFIINRQDAIKAFKQIAPMLTDNADAVHWTPTAIQMRPEDPESEKPNVKIPLPRVRNAGQEFTITLDCKRLIQLLQGFPDVELQIVLNGSEMPLVIEGSIGYAVLMPMSVKW